MFKELLNKESIPYVKKNQNVVKNKNVVKKLNVVKQEIPDQQETWELYA